ncbi:PQQ-binding-like beta-propeller repeat protein [Anatilimnocola sp. NA78]|uniref:outer membrane protein assembly factor BamB family protein n=1 Tax=Anatilimnocola sp. NA78 TaxID=3415683 RepID=UPI003CE523FC
MKLLDLAEEQGLLEPQVIQTLRKQIQSRGNITAELIAKTLIDKKLLTAFQAKKLLASAVEAKPAETLLDLTIDEPLDSPPAAEEDDVVMLEAVEPEQPVPAKPQPPAPKTKAPKPQPKAEAPKPTRPAPASPPVEAPLVDLMPLDGLSPISGPGADPFGAPSSLGGMDDLLAPLPGSAGGDPFASQSPPSPLGEQPPAAKPGLQKKVRSANVWDSPLLLLGGGALMIMVVAFFILYFALTSGSASEVFTKAEEEYRGSNYAAAISAFDQYLEKYPKDKDVSRAKVLRGMAQIRQVSSNAAKDPRSALKVASEVLPVIKQEPTFADSRDELASILPEIADGFAEQAKTTDQMNRKVELTKLADESMMLVNNTEYLPAAQRKNLEARIAGIIDKLNMARRSIDQDKDLQTAIGNITTLVGEGKTAESYTVRTELVRKYPGLEPHPQLIETTLAISERERQAVRMSETAIAPATDDPRPASQRIVVATRTVGTAPAPNSRPVFVTIEGAVYGLDLASGKVLWRRYVGHETQVSPATLGREATADVLIADARTLELYRLEAATGKVRWRIAIGEPFYQPTIADGKLLVATASGKLLEIQTETGASDRRIVLPQKLNVPPAQDAKSGGFYQVGEHSTVFALNDSLACTETFYLGHKTGSILVPPILAVDHLLVVESPADDYSLLHVLARDEATKKLREVHRPFRLKGRVVTPMGVAGRRVTVVTDLGEVNAFEVDPAIKDQPVQPVGKIEASEPVPTLLYQATDGGRLWLAGRRLTLYELQVSLQQLGRKWSLHQDDAFLASPQIFGETLLHVRRRPNSPAVLVEACQATDGKTMWLTQLAVPLVGLAADIERRQFVTFTSQGRVFEIPAEALTTGYYDQPAFTPPSGTGQLTLRDARQLPDGRLLSLGKGGTSYALFYDLAANSDRSRLIDLGPTAKDVATQTVTFKQNVVLPLGSGRVELLDPTTTKPASSPFQPPLKPGARIAWNEPTVIGSDRAVAVGDGKQTVYRLALKEGGQPALAKEAEGRVEGTLISPIASAGDFVYAVVREGSGDALQIFQAGNLAAGAKLPLGGRWKAGPVAVGDKIFIELQERKLICFEQDRQAWQIDLSRGPLSATPQPIENDLLLLHAAGTIVRIDPATGKEISTVEVGEPLGEVVTLFGPRLLVGGRDGVIHVAAQPQAKP